jgi:Transposase, Mutator family
VPARTCSGAVSSTGSGQGGARPHDAGESTGIAGPPRRVRHHLHPRLIGEGMDGWPPNIPVVALPHDSRDLLGLRRIGVRCDLNGADPSRPAGCVPDWSHRGVDEFSGTWGNAGPFTFVTADALTTKVPDDGRVINGGLLATGVNNDGHREVLGMRVATAETGAAWNEFFADLVTRGLSGVRLVTPTPTPGCATRSRGNLPGAAWQRCRDSLRLQPKGLDTQEQVAGRQAMLHSVYDRPDATAVQAQLDRLLDYVEEKYPTSSHTSTVPASTCCPSPRSEGDLGPDLVEQPRASQQGDPPPHRRRRGHLPRPQLRDPTLRSSPGRPDQRMGRRPPLPRTRRPRMLTPQHRAHHRTRDRS